MKSGKTLQELAIEIERQAAAKRDFIAPALQMAMKGGEMLNLGESDWGVTSTAHEQIANRLDIPVKYYNRMKEEAPKLLDENVNHWFKSNGDGKMLVRTLDGNVRAMLSDRYRPLDNADLAEAVLPKLLERNLMVISSEITEKRLYIKAVDMNIVKDIPTGAKMGSGHTIFNTLSPAITISNSEIGFGTLSVLGSIYTRQCTNLATFGEASVRKYHLGSKFAETETTYELLSDRTKLLSDAALWSQIGDVVGAAFDQARFDANVMKLGEATSEKIEGKIEKVIELTGKRFGFNDGEKQSVLRHLITGGDLSKYGLHSAVTRAAEDLTDYDRASEFERIGGHVIELKQGEWKEIANAQ